MLAYVAWRARVRQPYAGVNFIPPIRDHEFDLLKLWGGAEAHLRPYTQILVQMFNDDITVYSPPRL
jgi:hypothetical protein